MDFDKMDYSKAARFFPNECYVCKGRYALELCKCKMISYCEEEHRLQHLPIHEPFCQAILEMLKENDVCHIYDKLADLNDSEWNKKRSEIYQQLKTKLGRPLSSLEDSMFYRPRVCFICRKFNECLKNCCDCSIATFCEEHQISKIHKKTCWTMSFYLELLFLTDELNIDLQFLPSSFPFITEERKIEKWDPLTYTMKMDYSEEDFLNSRSSKLNLCDFIYDAANLHCALEIIYKTIPSEIIIHINALHFTHVFIKENYWEFLLHLNPNIKLLKIIITGVENFKHSETSLCKNCRLMEKTLLVEIDSRPYEQYMLNEDYKVPNILFYNINNRKILTEEVKTWTQYVCPIILKFDVENISKKTKRVLKDVTTYQIIHKGRFCYHSFYFLSTTRNFDYYFILKSKENSSTEENNDKMENAEYFSESGTDSGDSETIEVENEMNAREIEAQNNFNVTEIEDGLSMKKKPDTDVESVSCSSSFVIISKSLDNDCMEDGNKDKKPDENTIVLESTSNDSNVNNEKLVDKNMEKNIKDGAEKNEVQINTLDLKKLESEGKLNSSELFLMKRLSFLEKHILFLENVNRGQEDKIMRQQDEIKRKEDENKRQQDEKERNILFLQDEIEKLKILLTSAVDVVTKFQNKLLQIQ